MTRWLAESLLKNKGVAIIISRIGRDAAEKVEEKLLDKVSELEGRRIDEKFIKFAGFWLDSSVEAHEIRYNAMLVLV